MDTLVRVVDIYGRDHLGLADLADLDQDLGQQVGAIQLEDLLVGCVARVSFYAAQFEVDDRGLGVCCQEQILVLEEVNDLCNVERKHLL